MRLAIFGRRESAEAEDAPLSVSGNARIAGGAAFPSGLVANDGLTVGAGARITGSIRVAGMLTLESDARVEGDVLVDGDVYVARGAGVDGRLVCRRLHFGAPPGNAADDAVAATGEAPFAQAPAA